MREFNPLPLWYRLLPKPVQVLVLGALLWLGAQPAPTVGYFAFVQVLLVLAITFVLSELLRPKPRIENARPASLGDFEVPTATEGRPVPLIWGRVRMKGPNVVWYGDLRQTAITQGVRVSIFKKTRQTVGFRYYLGMQMALCRGPNVVLKRVWIDDKEVFDGTISTSTRFDVDRPLLFGGDTYGNGGIQATVDFYIGTSTQPINAYLDTSGRQRVGTTAPRYSGTCHLVLREMTSAAPASTDIGAYIGNSTSIRPWSFEVERFPALFAGQTGNENKINLTDANPVNVIYELLTNSEWGFGFSATDIDVGAGSSFLDAANTMITENNGFSMILDRVMQAKEMLAELQRQIDGVVFLDQSTGKWRIKLARDDYDIDTVAQITDAQVAEILNFTRGSWEDTTNQVQVKFSKREDDYKESYALAQDPANAIIAGGGVTTAPQGVTGELSFPGVKTSFLAANIAWRELRAQTYPLARASIKLNRQNWDLRIGDVFAWTSVSLGFTKLPMRITRIDYGRLDSNVIQVECVQDIYRYAGASMGSPFATQWSAPVYGLTSYPSTQQLAFEAPRALARLNDDAYFDNLLSSYVACAARRQSNELGFRITQRNAGGSPTGSYTDDSDSTDLMLIGVLSSNLANGTAIPTSTISLNATFDSASALVAWFNNTVTTEELSANLTNLIMVGDEFMLVSSANLSGANVILNNVYRGVLDSVQQSHTAGDRVYLLAGNVALTANRYTSTNNIDVELRSFAADSFYAGAVTAISFTLNRRAQRPYPPACTFYNGGTTPFGTLNDSADTSGGSIGFNVTWRRRLWTTTDEIASLQNDDAGVSAYSTEYRVRVFVDPTGTNVEIAGSPFAWAAGTGPRFINRLLLWDEAAAGTDIRVEVEARHDVTLGFFTVTNAESVYGMIHDVTPTSPYSGYFYLGGKLRANVASNSYEAQSTGLFTVEIEAAYATSDVEINIDGAGWTTVIPAGDTSGKVSLNSGEIVQLRHTVNQTPSPNLLTLIDDSAAIVAYGVLKN